MDLHGNLTQNARQRNLASFAAGTSKVLVATDIAARGIHVEDVALVVHVDPPEDHKAFVHRSGRTARAGAIGTVVTLVTPEQVADTRPPYPPRRASKPRQLSLARGMTAIVAITGRRRLGLCRPPSQRRRRRSQRRSPSGQSVRAAPRAVPRRDVLAGAGNRLEVESCSTIVAAERGGNGDRATS